MAQISVSIFAGVAPLSVPVANQVKKKLEEKKLSGVCHE